MRQVLVVVVVMLLGACRDSSPTDSEAQAVVVASTTRTSASPTVRAPPVLSTDTGSFTMVQFIGDDLVDCMESTVAVPHKGTVTAEQIAMMLADGARTIGAERDPLRENGSAALSKFLAEMWEADPKKITDTRTMLRWPPEPLVELVKQGKLARVDSCPVDHVSLGNCEVTDASTSVHWSATRHYYDAASTRDSSRAMKNCLAVSGKWTAPAADDTSATMEVARQHSLNLQKLLR